MMVQWRERAPRKAGQTCQEHFYVRACQENDVRSVVFRAQVRVYIELRPAAPVV